MPKNDDLGAHFCSNLGSPNCEAYRDALHEDSKSPSPMGPALQSDAHIYDGPYTALKPVPFSSGKPQGYEHLQLASRSFSQPVQETKCTRTSLRERQKPRKSTKGSLVSQKLYQGQLHDHISL